mmetsp:Transcript_30026/g.58953  ORF Transcript_30026/g.58953 Transcript_30026/m.58953 type:complete len:116 (+) Transcript_30026:1083-1430(+)
MQSDSSFLSSMVPIYHIDEVERRKDRKAGRQAVQQSIALINSRRNGTEWDSMKENDGPGKRGCCVQDTVQGFGWDVSGRDLMSPAGHTQTDKGGRDASLIDRRDNQSIKRKHAGE